MPYDLPIEKLSWQSSKLVMMLDLCVQTKIKLFTNKQIHKPIITKQIVRRIVLLE